MALFLAWTRERKLVWVAIALCCATSAYIFLGYIDQCPPVLVEYPPPGKGCGCPADSLPGLRFIASDAKAAGIGSDGHLQRGHAYAIVFVKPDRGCHKALARIQSIYERCQQQKLCHLLLVSRASPEELEPFRKNPVTSAKRGRAAKALTVPLACDTEGEATQRYMRRYGAFVLPHAYVVGPDGVITWHGHTNRTQFVAALSQVLQLVAAPAAGPKKLE